MIHIRRKCWTNSTPNPLQLDNAYLKRKFHYFLFLKEIVKLSHQWDPRNHGDHGSRWHPTNCYDVSELCGGARSAG
jgi:hypothetical protein